MRIAETCGIDSVSVASDKRVVKITFNDGSEHKYHARWLLDNCSHRRQESTGQKLLYASDIDKLLKVAGASCSKDGSNLFIRWNENAGPDACVQESCFTSTWLFRNSYSDDALRAARISRTPNTPLDSSCHAPSVHFDELCSPEGMFKWLSAIDRTGLCVVEGMRNKDQECERVASLMGPVVETLYGKVFDVRAEKKPINIAYTNVGLDPHVDLNYYESPPGIQFLHCIEFSPDIRGGLSTFVDAFGAAERLRRCNPGAFETLTRVPATFQKQHLERKIPASYYYRRPHIHVNDYQDIVAVHWSPPFEGPLHAPFDEVEDYYDAYAAFRAAITDPNHTVAFKNEPGNMISFNQRRMLHGRTAFTTATDGDLTRHFQGCYVNIDDFLSKLRVLGTRLFGKAFVPDPTTRAGNADFR